MKEHQNWTDQVEIGNHTSNSRRSEVMFRIKIEQSTKQFNFNQPF